MTKTYQSQYAKDKDLISEKVGVGTSPTVSRQTSRCPADSQSDSQDKSVSRWTNNNQSPRIRKAASRRARQRKSGTRIAGQSACSKPWDRKCTDKKLTIKRKIHIKNVISKCFTGGNHASSGEYSASCQNLANSLSGKLDSPEVKCGTHMTVADTMSTSDMGIPPAVKESECGQIVKITSLDDKTGIFGVTVYIKELHVYIIVIYLVAIHVVHVIHIKLLCM